MNIFTNKPNTQFRPLLTPRDKNSFNLNSEKKIMSELPNFSQKAILLFPGLSQPRTFDNQTLPIFLANLSQKVANKINTSKNLDENSKNDLTELIKLSYIISKSLKSVAGFGTNLNRQDRFIYDSDLNIIGTQNRKDIEKKTTILSGFFKDALELMNQKFKANKNINEFITNNSLKLGKKDLITEVKTYTEDPVNISTGSLPYLFQKNPTQKKPSMVSTVTILNPNAASPKRSANRGNTFLLPIPPNYTSLRVYPPQAPTYTVTPISNLSVPLTRSIINSFSQSAKAGLDLAVNLTTDTLTSCLETIFKFYQHLLSAANALILKSNSEVVSNTNSDQLNSYRQRTLASFKFNQPTKFISLLEAARKETDWDLKPFSVPVIIQTGNLNISLDFSGCTPQDKQLITKLAQNKKYIDLLKRLINSKTLPSSGSNLASLAPIAGSIKSTTRVSAKTTLILNVKKMLIQLQTLLKNSNYQQLLKQVTELTASLDLFANRRQLQDSSLTTTPPFANPLKNGIAPTTSYGPYLRRSSLNSIFNFFTHPASKIGMNPYSNLLPLSLQNWLKTQITTNSSSHPKIYFFNPGKGSNNVSVIPFKVMNNINIVAQQDLFKLSKKGNIPSANSKLAQIVPKKYSAAVALGLGLGYFKIKYPKINPFTFFFDI